MKALCPLCQAPAAAADINIQAMQALCRNCSEVFALKGQTVAVEPPQPARFVVAEDTTRRLEVSWRWWQWQHLFLVFFCIAWDAFMIFWYAMALGMGPGKHGGSSFNIIAVIFPIGHVAVGVCMTYYLIAVICNRTRVRADGDQLEIRHAPVPWKGTRTIPLRDLANLRVEESKMRNRNNPTGNFALAGSLAGQDVKLLSGLEENETKWLQWKISALLPEGPRA